MRVLFISDAHLNYDIETNSSLVTRIVKKTNPDLILSSGDWDFDKELFGKGFTVKDFLKMFQGVNTYSILGNHDNESGEIDHLINEVKNTDGSRMFFEGLIEYNGVRILGKSTFFNSENIGEFVKWVIQNRGSKPDFLLLHECPVGRVNMLNWVIEVIEPRVILCGHVHDKSFHHEEVTVFRKTTDTLCSRHYVKVTIDLIKVITFPPFMGYAVIDYNPSSREVLSLTLSRLI